MKIGGDPLKWLQKKAKRGVRGYPVGTVAFYGPDDRRASKIAASVLRTPNSDAFVRRWFADAGDIRADKAVMAEISIYFREQGVHSVAIVDRIIGCPHEEGIDYPNGEACPRCPFWAGRDRWSGLLRTH